jgi:hypothetical protein
MKSSVDLSRCDVVVDVFSDVVAILEKDVDPSENVGKAKIVHKWGSLKKRWL